MKSQEYYSLLIETVIDGEATEAERRELFDALADNAALRREFDEAVQFSATLTSARAAYNAPPELAAAVYAEAGFTAAPVAAGVSVLQMGVALVVGAMLTTSLFLFPWKTVFSNHENTRGEYGIPSVNTPQSSAMKLSKTPPETLQTTIDAPIQTTTTAIRKNTHRTSPVTAYSSPNNNGIVANNIPLTAVTPSSDNSNSLSEHRSESADVMQCNDLKTIATSFSHRNRNVPSVSVDEDKEELIEDSHGGYRLWIRGMMDMKHFPARPEANNVPLLNAEGALGIFWQATQTQSLGLEAGREVMPLFVVHRLENGGINYELAEKNYFAAVWYRNGFEIAGVPLYSAAGLGVSEAGPLAKAQMGLLYSFSNNFHGLFGVEFTHQQFYRDGKQWRAAQRLALTFSLGITLQE